MGRGQAQTADELLYGARRPSWRPRPNGIEELTAAVLEATGGPGHNRQRNLELSKELVVSALDSREGFGLPVRGQRQLQQALAEEIETKLVKAERAGEGEGILAEIDPFVIGWKKAGGEVWGEWYQQLLSPPGEELPTREELQAVGKTIEEEGLKHLRRAISQGLMAGTERKVAAAYNALGLLPARVDPWRGRGKDHLFVTGDARSICGRVPNVNLEKVNELEWFASPAMRCGACHQSGVLRFAPFGPAANDLESYATSAVRSAARTERKLIENGEIEAWRDRATESIATISLQYELKYRFKLEVLSSSDLAREVIRLDPDRIEDARKEISETLRGQSWRKLEFDLKP